MFMHQTWKESRLKLPDDIFEEGDDYVTLPPEFFENLWQPDPYFLNSKVAGKCFQQIDRFRYYSVVQKTLPSAFISFTHEKLSKHFFIKVRTISFHSLSTLSKAVTYSPNLQSVTSKKRNLFEK